MKRGPVDPKAAVIAERIEVPIEHPIKASPEPNRELAGNSGARARREEEAYATGD